MEFPSLQEIQTMSLHDLHKTIFSTFERKEFTVLYKEVPRELLTKSEMQITDLKDFFDFKVEESVYYFPYVDERKLFNHSFLGHRLTPAKGFFWWVEPVVKERMFGLVDVEFSIAKVSVKANDERYENIQKVYSETKSFYYNYEQEKYVQVNKKAVNDETTEYKHRESQYAAVLERLEDENLAYLGRLEKYVRYFIKQEPDRVAAFQQYFGYYMQFLTYELPFLEFKFLLGHVDGDNYYQLKLFLNDLKAEVSNWLEQLKQMETRGLLASFKEHSMYDHSRMFEGMNRTINKICSMFKQRDYQMIRKEKKTTMDGFYRFDANRLYPNLVQIELERAFKTVGGGVDTRKKEEAQLLETLLKDQKESANKTESKQLFTNEQLQQLDQLVGTERVTYLTDLLNRLVTQKIIEPSEKVMYLKLYR